MWLFCDINIDAKHNGSSSVRQSNFELLRIVAILFIILHHISVHTSWEDGGVFSPNTFTVNMFFLQGILPLGKIGVNIFVLISGYFLINSTKSTWAKLFSLWLELLFYSVIISVFFAIYDNYHYTLREMITIVTPAISYIWWFASTYLVMLALSPFINKMIKACDEKEHFKLIFGTIILWSVIPMLMNIWLEFSNLLWFISLYVIAAYVRLYPIHFNKSSKFYISFAFMIYFILLLCVVYLDFMGSDSNFWGITNKIDHNNMMNSLFSVSISLLIFLSFMRYNLKQTKIINYIAGATFAIYLIHDHAMVRERLYSSLFHCGDYLDSCLMIPYLLLVAMTIFLVCASIEFVRAAIYKRFFCSSINSFVEKVELKWDRLLDNKLTK